jgi:integrase
MTKKKGRGNGDGDVYPRKNREGKVIGYRGTYCVQTADGPKRRYVSGKNKGETRAALNKARADRDGGFVFDAGTLTLGDYLDKWLKDSVKNTVRRSSYVRYEGIVNNHVSPTLGRLKLKSLTPAHVRRLYIEKLETLSPRSVNYIHVTLHKALRQAVRDGLIPRNVTEAVKTPQVHRKEVTPLSPTQVKALLTAASGERLEALYLVAVHTGLRQGELLGLKWTDVDLDAGTISVQRSLDADGTFNPPKRAKSRRTVRLTAQAAEALRSHRAAQNEERLRLGSLWEDHGLVFPNRVGKPMDHNNLYHRDFKTLLEIAGLAGQGFTFHSLRHTCATLLVSKNVNPKIVQEMLGHATISQTMDTYSHVLPGMQDQAASAMQEALDETAI